MKKAVATSSTIGAVRTPPSTVFVIRCLISILLGFSAFFILLFGFILVFELSYQDKIYPGISVAGIDLSGLTQDQAAAKLFEQITYPAQGKVLLRYGDQNWIASPAELGLFLDAVSSARAAYNYGRSGGIQRLQDQFET